MEQKEKISNPIEHLGYIEPGHGLNGKQRWLSSDDDLEQMYSVLKQKPYEVTLLCYTLSSGQGLKRPATFTEGNDKPAKTPQKPYYKHVDKMA